MIDPNLTPADRVVLQVLLDDAERQGNPSTDEEALRKLTHLSESESKAFQPVVFTSWDYLDISPAIRKYLLQPYISWAATAVRNPSDIVYVTHLLILTSLALSNLILLFINFTWIRAGLQLLLVGLFMGPFSIITHHHIHSNGLFRPRYAWVDLLFPYLLDPMMGQTWNGFYYHHKHHHIEDNGPDDLSSTIRYQRDNPLHLLIYLTRFIFLIWIELPIYYIRHNRTTLGLKFLFWELASYTFILALSQINFPATLTGLIIPLFLWRIAVMTNNWSQHALISPSDPTSPYKSSVTILDVTTNRHGLNDGYHISHHLSPRRHWRDHPYAFLKSKDNYVGGGSVVLKNVDFIKLAWLLCAKEYEYLAEKCLVVIGDEQKRMSTRESADWLREKTRRFSEAEIEDKFRKH